MRALLIVPALMLSWNVAAFDGSKAVQGYNEARPGCRQAEMNGNPISPEESAKQCKILAELGKELKNNGFCWNATEQDWAACK